MTRDGRKGIGDAEKSLEGCEKERVGDEGQRENPIIGAELSKKRFDEENARLGLVVIDFSTLSRYWSLLRRCIRVIRILIVAI